MPVSRQSLIHCCESLLQPTLFKDYCPNGLQVQGSSEIKHLVSGVTICTDLIDEAIAGSADAILVHHGLFWHGDDYPITGMLYERVQRLIHHRINLLAYHLPLDAHVEIGNNRVMADDLGINIQGPLQSSDAPSIGYWGELGGYIDGQVFAERLAQTYQREPLFIPGHDRPIRTIGWCSGAAHKDISHAIRLGLDAFVTGEAREETFHLARENGIHFYAAGHHATERGGIFRLGDYCASKLDITHRFVEITNPI